MIPFPNLVADFEGDSGTFETNLLMIPSYIGRSKFTNATTPGLVFPMLTSAGSHHDVDLDLPG
jgi:hypothetical protein